MRQGGFTLIETLFAFVIFVTGIVTLIGLLITSSQASRVTPDRLVAILLADEALSIIQNIRDSNISPPEIPWDAGIALCDSATPNPPCILGYDFPNEFVGGAGVCDLDDTLGFPQQKLYRAVSDFTRVRHHDFNGYFQVDEDPTAGAKCPDATTLTKFTREILVDYSFLVSDGYIVPTVTVRWNDGVDHKVEMSTKLYDWFVP